MTEKISAKKIAVCIALFIPLIVAIVFAINVDPNSVTAENLKKLTVEYEDGSFSFSDKATLELYSAISENSRKIDGTFRDFSAETPYTVTYTEDDGLPITYTLYMSKNTDDCVYVSPDGEYFMMDEKIASELVVREEFSSLNELKSLPNVVLTGLGEGVTLYPDSYKWTYTALDSNKVTLDGTGKRSNALVKFDNSENGMLTLEFDKNPDALTLKITGDNGVVFDDKYENLSQTNKLAYNSDTKLTLVVTAQWYELDGADCFGEAVYTVPLLYDVEPTYSVVDKNGVPAGDFTVLRISDFNDGEKLTVVNDIGLPETLDVYDGKDGVKIVFIPMGCDLEKGTYTLKLRTESGHEKDVEVKVSRGVTHDSYSVIFTDEQLSAAFTEENFKEFEALTSELTSKSKNEHLYSGKFAYPTGSSAIANGGFSYGSKLDVISLYSKKYTHSGMQLKAAKGQSVVATNGGTVVFAGNTGLYGNTVIVDHGCGILSYYGNLDEITAKVGDVTVGGETVLGKAGSTGFACVRGGAEASTSTMVYFAISIDGVFIDPQSPCKYGVNI